MRLAIIKVPLLAAVAILQIGCATVPTDFPKTETVALRDTECTYLGQVAKNWVESHDGRSGFYPLIAGMDGLGARLSLADLAEKSIDAQYFLMKADSAGLLFVLKLTEAADRGVRVRLLLDDIFTSVDDQILAVLSRHPNIELRLFNPVGRGGSYYANYLADFKQANRRMHNKSLTVDNQISVVGGRNIADEYFELLAGKEFKDFDMLALGPVAAEIASTFDLFWNHKLAIPIEAFQEDRETESLQHVRARMGSSESAESETLSQPIAQRRFEHSVD